MLSHLPGLTEWGQPSGVRFFDRSGNCLLAVGYERLLFGDHGPYLEFSDLDDGQLQREAFGQAHPKLHYDEHFALSTDGRPAKLYRQKRTVTDKPNPPRSGPYWVANQRDGVGYADYRVGRCYISCDAVSIVFQGENIGHKMPAVDIVADRREAMRVQMLQQ